MCRKGIHSGGRHEISGRNFHSNLCALFVHKKLYLEDAADVTSFMLRSFRHIATIVGCMFHFISKSIVEKCERIVSWLLIHEKLV